MDVSRMQTYVRETTVNRYVSELPDIMDTDYDDIY